MKSKLHENLEPRVMNHHECIAVMTRAKLRLPDAGADYDSIIQSAQSLPWRQLLLTQEELKELHLTHGLRITLTNDFSLYSINLNNIKDYI